MNTDSLGGVIILLGVAVAAVWLVRRLHMPAALGYLLAGIFVGPHVLGWVPDNAGTSALGEIGIVFLLFTIGLEFSLSRLVSMRREVFLLGGLQVGVSLALAALVLYFFAGVRPVVAVLMGGAVAMSSTALVAKQLGEQLELRQIHGRLAIGVLLFQDLAVIPLLILIPALASSHSNLAASGLIFATVLGKGIAVVIVMILVARFVVRPLLLEVSSHHSGELFLLTSLLIALTAAWATQTTGLSLALGAFVAGAILAESAYRPQIEADIRPFRDILLGLFFITVGMYADPRLYLNHAPIILVGTLALIVFKTLIVLGAGRLLKAPLVSALRTGLVLGQGGEFGLALLTLGLSRGYLTGTTAQIAFNILVLSMIVSPLLVRYNEAIASWLSPSARPEPDIDTSALAVQESDMAGHVILVGYGRVGQNLARFLDEEGFAYVALDLDPKRVHEAHAGGDPVYFGDARQTSVLEAAGISRARALVVSYSEVETARTIIESVRRLRQDLPILVRTRDDSHLDELLQAGADEIIPETLESSLMVASHLLAVLGVPMRRILRRVTEVRSQRYALMRNVYRREDAAPLDNTHAFREQLDAITLGPGAPAQGRSLADLRLEELGVNVTALRRAGIVGREPDPETVLQPTDTLVLYGTPEAIRKAENRLLEG
jgi:CPA2 family monovalent cation:H+ antiporter-2